MVSAVSDTNAHCIFRSSIGQYVAELPFRFIVGSIYSFLIWICLFLFLLLPVGVWSLFLLLVVLSLFIHTIAALSSFGRIVMHTGAMGETPIFEKKYEASLLPHSLHALLLTKAKANLANKTSIRRQYLSHVRPIAKMYSEDEMSGHLSGNLSDRSALSIPSVMDNNPAPPRKRTESLVKFADGYDTTGHRILKDTTTVSPRQPSRKQAPSKEVNIVADPTLSSSALSPLTPATTTGSSIRKPPRPTLARKWSETPAAVDIQEQEQQQEPLSVPPPTVPDVAAASDFAERWLSTSTSTLADEDVLDTGEILLGPNAILFSHNAPTMAATATSDNPYLLHPSTSPIQRPQGYGLYDGASSSLEVSEDERFEQEYGHLFDSEDEDTNDVNKNASPLLSTNTEQPSNSVLFRRFLNETADETRRLLEDTDRLERGDYHSTSNNNDKTKQGKKQSQNGT